MATTSTDRLVSLAEVAEAFGFTPEAVEARLPRRGGEQEFYTLQDLAVRWKVSRPSVYNILRRNNAKILDLSAAGKRGKRVVPLASVKEIEGRRLKAFK